MTVSSITAWLLLLGCLGGLAFLNIPDWLTPTKSSVTLGVIAPLSGDDARQGREMVNGIRTFVNRFNGLGALQDYNIVLDVRDNAGDPAQSAEAALALSEDDDVLGIIGPLSDQALQRVGGIGQNQGVPVISGADGAADVSFGKEWLFRSGLTSELQGRVLAHYLVRVMGETRATLIKDDSAFGNSLGLALSDELSLLHRSGVGSLTIENTIALPMDPEAREPALEQMVSDLVARYAGEILILAVDRDHAIPVLRHIQDNPKRRFGKVIPYRLAGPSSFSDPAIAESFAQTRREQEQPGLYTNGMLVVAPFLRDTNTQSALAFRHEYQRQFGGEPSALAAASRDAAAILSQAMVDVADLTSLANEDLAAARTAIRDRLAWRDRQDRSVAGVTGNLFMDADGNALNTVPMGLYRHGKIISPQTQLLPTLDREMLDPRDIIQIHGNFFTKAAVVHTGIDLNEIRSIDLESRRAELDFHIWFRYQGDVDLNKIQFLNAAEPVSLGAPVEDVLEESGLTYRLYHVTGDFKTDFLPETLAFGESQIGIQLRDLDLNRSQLLLVPDHAAMNVGRGSWTPEAVERRILPGEGPSWTVNRIDLYQDTQPINVRGNPLYDRANLDGFSRFNLGIALAPTTVTVRGLLEETFALQMFLISGIALALTMVFGARHMRTPHVMRLLWFPQFFLVLVMMVCAEEVVVDWMTNRHYPVPQVAMATTIFHVLWWAVPAKMLTIAMERFIWTNLEQRTGREVPNVVRKFFSIIVYILALMGILAFVFDQKITSLLATSGVLAMIIGLAIQMNLANIFSGIAINIEKPFRIGDWIKIGDYEPGQVISMTWRTTRVQTIDNNVICVPNSVASDTTLENYSYPSEAYRSQLEVHVDPGARPAWVEKILMDAVLANDGVLPDPAPEVRFDGVKAWSGEYHIRYYCAGYPDSVPLDSLIWRNVIRNLHYAGFESRIHQEFTLFHLKEEVKQGHDQIPTLMKDIEVFEPFGRQERERISKLLKRRMVEPGEVVVSQGDAGDSLFIIAAGVLAVDISLETGDVMTVAKLGVGDFFGEMALLTGEPRTATVTTVTSSVVLELKKDQLQPIIQEFPNLTEDLSEMLTRRTLDNMRKRRAMLQADETSSTLTNRFLTRMSRFFNLSGPEAA
ncbi:MAG: ABC transporter substrate-binding protein [Rhodospirillaceae bacterium]